MMHGARFRVRWGCEEQGWGRTPVFSIRVRQGNGAMAKRGCLGPSQLDKYEASIWHLRSPQRIQSAPMIQGHAHSQIPFAIQHSILHTCEPGVEDVARSIGEPSRCCLHVTQSLNATWNQDETLAPMQVARSTRGIKQDRW